mmetsp:Transcript_44671/g.69909  ORF Transcript_44671/g.69909 Transcript_44671/m.69909 type:complete len:360 (+) Transcript_44671:1-1080(+)
MAWDDDEEDDWEKNEEPELAPQPPKKKDSEWSDEEEEEDDEDEQAKIEKLREEKVQLEKRLAEITELIPMEQPKESTKKGKQQKKLLKEKEEEDRRRAAEALAAEEQVSLQRKIEEADFENAQDMFGGGSGGPGGSDSGKFESWPLTRASKQPEVEEFAVYTAQKITKFSGEYLYLALIRKLLQETTKSMDVSQAKELMLVLTKGKEDFTVVDLVRGLFRDADKDISAEDISKMLNSEGGAKKAAAPKKGQKEAVKLTSRQELLKLIIHDFVVEMRAEDFGRIVEEGCGIVLTRDQQQKIVAAKRELTGDPNAPGKQAGKGTARVADHKSMSMYEAFGSGGGDDWGGGGGTRGDDYDFM